MVKRGTNKKLSIVIAAYNSEKYIKECIESVLDQNYNDYELIVVDDGSYDSTPLILSHFKDKRVRIVTQKNHGRSEARNTGISLANGKYIWVIDHDDKITKNCIAPIVNIMETLNTDVFVVAPPIGFKSTLPADCQIETVEVTQVITGKEFLMKDASYWAPWQFIIRKDFYEKHNFRFRLRYFLEDVELMYRVFYHAERFAALKDFSCYAYIQRPESETKKPWTKNKILDFAKYVNLVDDFVRNEVPENELRRCFELKRTQFYINGINNWKTIRGEMKLSEYLEKINSIPHYTYGTVIERIYQLLSFYKPDLLVYKPDLLYGSRYPMNVKHYISDIIRRIHIDWLRVKSASKKDINVTGETMIVAPHPDDEVIGCGGLIARLVNEGKTPHIIVMTGGEGSHQSCCSLNDEKIKVARRGLTRKALAILGVPENNIHELDFPDGGIDISNHQTDKLKHIIEELKPDTIFVPHRGEGWPDHIKTAQIVKGIAPADVTIWEYCVWMWYYNVWRGLDWNNAVQLCMTSTEHRLKLAAMDAYIRPLASCGKPWSGVLPKVFVEANQWKKELYFKVR